MSNITSSSHNKSHYDSVTDAWTFILGSNLHYGYFSDTVKDLDSATDALVTEMAGYAGMGGNKKVLDVGCGIGHPALMLNKSHDANVTGISISERGIQLANELAEKEGVEDSVQFHVLDALNNTFDAERFDLVWQMESSHLIHDKEVLFNENLRVLKPGGRLILCDLFLVKEFSVAEIFKYRKELGVLEKSFGKAKMCTVDYYREVLERNGYINIESRDISVNCMPTLDCWKENVMNRRDQIIDHLDDIHIENFIAACDILNDFFKNRILGYAMIKADKVG
jgi:27-O-demethylrifamycin SV methyltransferase